MAKRLGCFIKEARQHIQEWNTEQAEKNIQTGQVKIIDVREPDEFAAGHLPGAINVPRGVLEAAADASTAHRHPELCAAHAETVLLYCQSGGRSAMAAWVLQQMGFEQVYSLAGGIACWDAEGFAVHCSVVSNQDA